MEGVSKLESHRRKKKNKVIKKERITHSDCITTRRRVGLSRQSTEDGNCQDGSSVSEEDDLQSPPTMDMMYGVSPGAQAQQTAYSYQHSQQAGFIPTYPHRGSSSSDTSGQPPKPINIEQYLATASQEHAGRPQRQSRAERSQYSDQTVPTCGGPYGGHPRQPHVYHHQQQQQQQQPQGMQQTRATPDNSYWRKYGSQDETYRQPFQAYQRGSWDGSKPSPPDEAKKSRWNRDRSLDTGVSSKRRGNTVASSGGVESYRPTCSAPWDPNRLSRDSSMESIKSQDSSKVVKSSTPNVLAYTPRRAKPFVAGRSTTVDISSLDRSSRDSLGSIGDVSQPIQENRETRFVAPWRVKDRPSSQVFEPSKTKETVQPNKTKETVQPNRQPLVKSASLDKPYTGIRTGHCDSPDLDELVEANLEAAKDSPSASRKPRKEKKKDLSRRITDHRLSERSKTMPENYGEELSYCPAVTYQPTFEKHVAQVTQVDQNKLTDGKQTLKPPEEEAQNLSDFEKHLQGVKSELKTPYSETMKKDNVQKDKAKESADILGVKVALPKIEAVVNGNDEKAIIEALKGEKPALADLLERDREPPKPPEYHDTDLAAQIASEKQKEIKRKHLLFKLGEIRKELSSRINFIEEKTKSAVSRRKNKPLLKSKSLGEENMGEKSSPGSRSMTQNVSKSPEQLESKQLVKTVSSETSQTTQGAKPDRMVEHAKPEWIKDTKTQEQQTSKQQIKTVSPEASQTMQYAKPERMIEHARPDRIKDVVTPIHKSAITDVVHHQEDKDTTPLDTRPFSPTGSRTTRSIMSPIHMTTKSSSIHQPQMGISYGSVIKTPPVTSVTTNTSTAIMSTDLPSTSAYSSKPATPTVTVNTQHVCTATTSTVTTSHTTGAMVSSAITSTSSTTKPVSHAPASLRVSDESPINKHRSKSPDTETHGAVSLVKAIQSRLTRKDSGRISPKPGVSAKIAATSAATSETVQAASQDTKTNEGKAKSQTVQEAFQDINQTVQEAFQDINKGDVIKNDQVVKPTEVVQIEQQPYLREKPSLEMNESVQEITNDNKTNLRSDYAAIRQDLSPKPPAISPTPVTLMSAGNSSLVYQGTTFRSPKELLSHQLQQIAPTSELFQVEQTNNFQPMAETLETISDKQSHLDLYERKHALSTHKAVVSPPRPPEFGISYLKKTPTSEKLSEDLGRLDEDVGYPQVMLIETPKTANRTPSPRRAAQYSSESSNNKVLTENVFQFPPRQAKESTMDNFLKLADEQRKHQQRQEDERRRKELYREDSFARESSPEYSPIPLPKDSVILRNKHQSLERRGSTSSDSDVTVGSQSSKSPRLSPRTMRKQAQAQKMKSASNRGSTSSGIGIDLLNIPAVGSAKDALHMHGRPSKSSPRGSTTSLPQTSKHIGGSRERVYHTPPGTPQKKAKTLPAGTIGRTSSADTVAVVQCQDNATVPASDSSTNSKRGEGRRRFRKRDTPPVQSDPSCSVLNTIQTQTAPLNVLSKEPKQPINQGDDVPPSVLHKEHVQKHWEDVSGGLRYKRDIQEDQKASTVIEQTREINEPPDPPSPPVIILRAEPVIHEVSYLPAITAEPVIQEIEYKPILTPAVNSEPTGTQDKGQNISLIEADHFLGHRSADPSHVNTKTKGQGQDSRQFHQGPALRKQKTEAEPKPAKKLEVRSKNESPAKTKESYSSKGPLDRKSGGTVVIQPTKPVDEKKKAPSAIDKNSSVIKSDFSDPELKGNRKELDSAIQTLDALAKDLEDRQKDSSSHQADTCEVGETAKSSKKSVADVNAALSILRQNSIGDKQVSIERGGRGVGFRPSPLQLTSLSSGSQVPKTPPSEILSPPVVIISKKVSDSPAKDKPERPKSAERAVLMRSDVKDKTSSSPSRPKSGVGVSLLQRAQAKDNKIVRRKTATEVLQQQWQERWEKSLNQSKSTPQKADHGTDAQQQHIKQRSVGRKAEDGPVQMQQVEQHPTDEPEPKRQQTSSYLKQKTEEQTPMNQVEEQQRKEEKVQEESLKRLKVEEDNLRKQKEEEVKRLQLAKQKVVREKLQQQERWKQEVEIQNLEKRKEATTPSTESFQNVQQQTSDKVSIQPGKELPLQKVATLDSQGSVQAVKSEEKQSNENPKSNQPKTVSSKDLQTSEPMLMGRSQGGVQPLSVQKQQPSQSKQPKSGVEKQVVSTVIKKQPSTEITAGHGLSVSGEKQTSAQRQEVVSKQPNPTKKVPGTERVTNLAEEKKTLKVTTKQASKQPSPPRQGQGKQHQLQKQSPAIKQGSPQRQVQHATEKTQKTPEPSRSKVQSGQPKQQIVGATKKGPSPQRTVQPSSQRVQRSSPQRQLPKTPPQQKALSETSKTVDKLAVSLSRRGHASPQRTGGAAQHKDVKSSPSPLQQRQEPAQKAQPSANRTVRKTTTTTTTYTSGPGQKVQCQSSTTTQEVKPQDQPVPQIEQVVSPTTSTDPGLKVQSQTSAMVQEVKPKDHQLQQKTQLVTTPTSTDSAEKVQQQKVVQTVKPVVRNVPQKQQAATYGISYGQKAPQQKATLKQDVKPQVQQTIKASATTTAKVSGAGKTAQNAQTVTIPKDDKTQSQKMPLKQNTSTSTTTTITTTGVGNKVVPTVVSEPQSQQTQKAEQISTTPTTKSTPSPAVTVQGRTTAAKEVMPQGQQVQNKEQTVAEGRLQQEVKLAMPRQQVSVDKTLSVQTKKPAAQTVPPPQVNKTHSTQGQPDLKDFGTVYGDVKLAQPLLQKQAVVVEKKQQAQIKETTQNKQQQLDSNVTMVKKNDIQNTKQQVVVQKAPVSQKPIHQPNENHQVPLTAQPKKHAVPLTPKTEKHEMALAVQTKTHEVPLTVKTEKHEVPFTAKTTEDNKIALASVQSAPISIETSSSITETKAKVPLETHFPATDVEKKSPREKVKQPADEKTPVGQQQPQRSDLVDVKNSTGVTDGEGKASQDNTDTVVGVALSRLHRNHDGKDQLTSKKYDIQSGHRDVSSLSRKFGGSVEICSAESSEVKKDLSPLPSSSSSTSGQPVTTTMQQSKPQPTQAYATEPANLMQQSKPQLTQTYAPATEPGTTMQQSKPQLTQAYALATEPGTILQQSKPQPTQASAPESGVVKSRRTPERAMSLRDEKRSTPERERVLTKAYSSFRDGDVKRRKPRVEKSENLVDDELQKILNRRSNYLEDWEQQALSSEGETAADKSLAQFEARLKKEKQSKPESVIVDRELSQMLEQRRVNTDSESDTPTKSPAAPETSSTVTVAKQHRPTTQTAVSSILKQTSSFEMEIPEQPTSATSILKKESENDSPPPTKPVVSILKKDAQAEPDSYTQKNIKPILKKESSFEKLKQQQPVVMTSILVTPEVKQMAKQEAAPAQKTMRHFKLQKSKTLGEMPSESSEKVGLKKEGDGEKVKTVVVKPILRKAKTFDTSGEEMDPELASLLKSRRRGSSEEPVQEKRPDLQSPDDSTDKESGSEVRLSVAERIFQMQSKIEETSLPVSKTGSGSLGTPGVKSSSKSVPTSPGLLGNRTFGGSPVLSLQTSEDDLLTKLTDVATAEKTAADRRKRFQKNQDNWRRRTQPITEEEVKSADALESVNSFRAEILRHTSLNFFKQQAAAAEQSRDDSKSKTTIKKVKGQESFPQPMKRDRFKDRRKNNLGRYKSLPELNLIPESALLVSKERLRGKWASEIDRNKAITSSKPENKEDAEVRAQDVVPADIVKAKSSIFTTQQGVPTKDIQVIQSSLLASGSKAADSNRGNSLKKDGTTTTTTVGNILLPSSEKKNRTVVGEATSESLVDNKQLISSPRDINKEGRTKTGTNIELQQKDTASLKTTKTFSSQSNVTSKIASQTRPLTANVDIIGLSSDDDDFDKLVEINARTLLLMEDSSSSVSESVRLNITENDLSQVTLLKPPDETDMSIVDQQPSSSPEDEMSKMSLFEKLSKFKELDQKALGAGEDQSEVSVPHKVPSSSSSPRRLMNRKQRMERSQTQPITVEELSLASVFAKNEKEAEQQQPEEVTAVKEDTVVDSAVSDTTASEDELSKLSLAEKMKLFSSPSTSPQVTEDTAANTPPTKTNYQARRKGKKFQSRFKTQPVTPTEVLKASRISPLAMSLVKPPDPDTLKGLSLQERRELAAQHAELTLAGRSSPRSPLMESDPALHAADVGVNEEVNRHEGILKTPPAEMDKETKGILKSSSNQPVHPSDSMSPESSRKGILKHKTHEDMTALKGILKSGHSIDDTEETADIHQQQRSTHGIRGILKTESPKIETDDKLHGILKPGHSEKHEIRSILKSTPSGGSEETVPPCGTSQQDIKSSCDTSASQTKYKDVQRDQTEEEEARSALLADGANNQDLTSGSSEYQTASEPEVLQSTSNKPPVTVTAENPAAEVDIALEIDRLKALDVRVVQESDVDFKTKASDNSTSATKTVVSRTSLRLSSSDTSDTDDLHSLKVLSGQQRSPTKLKNEPLLSQEPDKKLTQEDSTVVSSSPSVKGDVVDKILNPMEGSNATEGEALKDNLVKDKDSSGNSVAATPSRYDSSTDDEPISRRIKNEAVARRRLNRDLRKSGDR